MPKKTIIPHRTPMPEQPPLVRAHNYEEVTYGYTAEQAIAEARRCLECAKPGCMAGCPVNVDIPAFLERIEEGDFRSAIDIIKKSNALPAITGRVCPQEVQCEATCLLNKKYEPVAIGRLERFVADWEAIEGLMQNPSPARLSGKKAAVVGAGPPFRSIQSNLITMEAMLHCDASHPRVRFRS